MSPFASWRLGVKMFSSLCCILEIALVSGFQNLANFNRQFCVSAGMPPRDYRKLRSPGL